jgi:hypothetical protein
MNPAPTSAPVKAPAAPERRIAARRQPAMGAVCRLDAPDGGPSTLALVWNISLTGISMLLHTPPDPGAALAGFLEVLNGDAMLRVAMKVVHVKQLDTGDYFVGAHFDNPLSADEMRPFVADG